MMTPDEMRVAIAEACGWRWFYSKHNHWIVTSPTGARYSPGEGMWTPFDPETGKRRGPFPQWFGTGDFLPDYCGSRDAMAEAEKRLTNARQQALYIEHLQGITQAGWTDEYPEVFLITTAKSLQRAEAFCRTLFPERFTA